LLLYAVVTAESERSKRGHGGRFQLLPFCVYRRSGGCFRSKVYVYTCEMIQSGKVGGW
jgi:hypothetical protein